MFKTMALVNVYEALITKQELIYKNNLCLLPAVLHALILFKKCNL